MNSLLQSHHPRKHARSFKFAFEGIFHALLNEPNFRVHVVATIAVVCLGFLFKISNVEWAIIAVVSAMVLTAEMMNTVVEQVIDHLFKEQHPVAKITKDLAAGYVLISAIAAVIIFVLLFGHRLRGIYESTQISKDKPADTIIWTEKRLSK